MRLLGRFIIHRYCERNKKLREAKRISWHQAIEQNAKYYRQAQVTIEFMFGMIIVMLAIYGALMIFRWAGIGLAERRILHDGTAAIPVFEDWKNPETVNQGPLGQADPNFYKMRPLCAVFGDCVKQIK